MLAFATHPTGDGDLEQAGDRRFTPIIRNGSGAITLQVRHEQQSKQLATSPRKQHRVQARSQEASNVAGAQQQRVRPALPGLWTFVRSPSSAQSSPMCIDWKEAPEAHVFSADLPGVKEADKVEVEDNVLVI